MISEKRQSLILQELEKKDFLSLQELIERAGCSASTIRRDLSKLQQLGRLQRVHGGATFNSYKNQGPILSEKLPTNLREKREIGRKAAQFTEDNDYTLMDAGSSTIEMIPLIKTQDTVVVTNGLFHVEGLLHRGIKTLMIGGEVKATTSATAGTSALEVLRCYCFDKAFMGMNDLDLNHGLTTSDEKETLIKERAVHQTTISYVLLDHSKLDETYFAHVSTEAYHVEYIVSEQLHHYNRYNEYKEKYHLLGG